MCGVKSEQCKETSTSKIHWAFFPEDPYVALEKVRKILGVSEGQLDSLMALLAKSDDGFLRFHVGNVWIQFHSIDEKEIAFDIEVRKKNIAKSVNYLLKTQPKDVKAVKSVKKEK